MLDIGAGFGEFLRHIQCRRRIAVDIERLSGTLAAAGHGGSLRAKPSAVGAHRGRTRSTSCSAATSSSIFRTRRRFSRRSSEIRTVLRPGGRLLALQPNIRYVGGAYWDFVDHHLPLTHVTLVEAAESLDYEIVEVIPRFLPYTTRSAIPQSPWLVRLYLAVRPAWWIMGQQTWFVARKPKP